LLFATTALAQEPAKSESPKFDDLLQRASAALADADAWSLDCRRHWLVESGDAKSEETSRYRFLTDRDGQRFRIEVQSEMAESPELICACDGREVTMLLAAAKIYSRGPAQTAADAIAGDQLLNSSLTGSGIQTIVQSDLARAVHAIVSDIEYAGAAMVDDAQAHQFKMRMRDGHAQLWLRESDGLPLKYQAVQPAAEGSEGQATSNVQFAWDLKEEIELDSFAISLPEDARRVTSLYGALAGDGATSLVGKRLPPLDLSSLDGVEVVVDTAGAKKPAVLIFWATWAAPSVRALPQTTGFVKEYVEKGVAFYAVNVGEEPSVIAGYLEGRKLQSTLILDRQGQASSALGLTRLPAAVLVGSDGNVRAVLQTEPGKLRESLAPELDKVLADAPPAGVPAAGTKAGDGAVPIQPAEERHPRRFRLRWRR